MKISEKMRRFQDILSSFSSNKLLYQRLNNYNMVKLSAFLREVSKLFHILEAKFIEDPLLDLMW